jgi:ribosome-binding factor A
LTFERPYKRTDRVSQQIKQILGEITTKYIDISHLGFITFTRVEISPDLRHSKVFYSIINNKKSDDFVSTELNKLAKAFRKYLGQSIRMKYTPEIKFYLDVDKKHEEHMLKILKSLDSGKS